MTRMGVGVLAAVLLMVAAIPDTARAQDDTLADVLVDGFYGGLIGALVGTAVMALTDHPRDHLSYITTGAGVGAIGGTAYGLWKAGTHAFVEVDRGRVTWRTPDVSTVASLDHDGRSRTTYSADLFRYHFE